MNLTNPIFTDETKAREHLERLRWPDGPSCPHCGATDEHVVRLGGKAAEAGLLNCRACRRKFTVAVGMVFERSHIPLHKWVLAFHLMSSSKKGMSAHQLHRMLDLTYKSAWFMAHRIREAMMDTNAGPLGGEGKIVEADETYYGPKDRVTKRTKRGKASHSMKRSVVALVERGGKARIFHVKHATAEGIRAILVRNVPRETTLYTDESRLYTETGREYATHETVHHTAGEYVRGAVHTNTVENVFLVFKRGMRGTYQHCGEAHLYRYLAEFEFRYNRRIKLGWDDTMRAADLIKSAEGKRLTYVQTNEAGHA